MTNKILEEMGAFFDARVSGYEEHMLETVTGCKEGYRIMAGLLPESAESILDLGCGTGLELDEIFKLFPKLKVTGIDLSSGMLNKLKEKHQNRNLNLIRASYLDYELGSERYDGAVSFQTLHHFSHEEKRKLYAKLCKSLVKDGIYIEADYMAPTQEYEDFHYAENRRIRAEFGITTGYYHYDTPCTVNNQVALLKEAGFKEVTKVWQEDNTVILTAKK